MAKESTVAIEHVVLDERCQARVELNPEAVCEYAEAYRDDVKLPPLDVVDVDGALVLIDGFHRLAGARQADHRFIRVTVVDRCDMNRAIWLASAVNQGHGVRRSNADKRLAIRLALNSEIGVEQSTHILAEHVGVDHKTAQKHRNEWEAEDKAKRNTQPVEALGKFPNAPETVITKDGRRYPKNRGKNSEPANTEPEPEVDIDQDDSVTEHEAERDDEQTSGQNLEGNKLADDYRAAAKILRRAWQKLCDHHLGSSDDVCAKVNEAIRLAEARAGDVSGA